MNSHQRKSPESAPHTHRAIRKNRTVTLSHIIREIVGTVLAALIFSVVMWSAVFGAAGGFDTGMDQTVMAGLLTVAHKRNPPYSKNLNRAKRTLWICCGSYAWERVQWPTWMPGSKVLLPLNQHPSEFKWSCAEGFEDCVIIAEGRQPYLDEVTYLAAELLVYVDRVLFIDNKGNTTRFDAETEVA